MYKRIKKQFKNFLNLLLPGLILVLFTFVISLTGALIDSDEVLLLTIGNSSIIVSAGIFLVANIFTWLFIYLLVPHYKFLLSYGLFSILIVLLVTILMHMIFFGYYVLIFILVLGVSPFDIQLRLSPDLSSNLLSMLLGLSLIISISAIVANILIYIFNKAEIKAKDDDEDDSDSEEVSSEFENIISI